MSEPVSVVGVDCKLLPVMVPAERQVSRPGRTLDLNKNGEWGVMPGMGAADGH